MNYFLNADEAAVVESMRKVAFLKRKRELSNDVALATAPNYFASPKDTICQVLSNRITARGFTAPDFNGSEIGETAEGSANFIVGPKCYLAVTWYRMESGNFEIVAYIS